jgi:hypothetical protein
MTRTKGVTFNLMNSAMREMCQARRKNKCTRRYMLKPTPEINSEKYSSFRGLHLF